MKTLAGALAHDLSIPRYRSRFLPG